MIAPAVLRPLALLLLAAAAPCQITRTTIPAPASVNPAYFDEGRDVLVCWDAVNNAMWEYDGANWVMIPCAAYPSWPAVATAWDAARGVFVAVDYWLSSTWPNGTTWEWDGAAWHNRGSAPVVSIQSGLARSWNVLVTYHSLASRVVLFTDGGLAEWTGSNWNWPAQSNVPPTWVSPHSYYHYGCLAYDARWQKVVLFGRVFTNTGISTPPDMTTYEWDAGSSWVQMTTLPGTPPDTVMWYDHHRGTVVRGAAGGATPSGFWFRDNARNWVQLQGTPVSVWAGCLDAKRNRYYCGDTPTTIAVLHDAQPAEFSFHAPGCNPAAPVSLALSESWTRAWLGQSMSIDVTAPHGVAVLATGFSDQAYGSTPLPIDLSGYGMPGCNLQVAPEVPLLGVGPSGAVTFTLPIPNVPGLLGVTFWQQALSLAIGANAADLLATDSVRGTVGWFR